MRTSRARNVIPFPRASRPAGPLDDAPALLPHVVAALQILGEPATVAEIAGLLAPGRQAASAHISRDIRTILIDFSDEGDARLMGEYVFRAVGVRGAEAWGIAPGFRDAGLSPALRSAV